MCVTFKEGPTWNKQNHKKGNCCIMVEVLQIEQIKNSHSQRNQTSNKHDYYKQIKLVLVLPAAKRTQRNTL